MRNWSTKTWVAPLCTLVLAACVLGIVEVHDRYFFNPLTFRNNDVLYLPWNWYSKPMSMEISNLSSLSAQTVDVTSSSEIRYVISQLEKGSSSTAITFTQYKNKPKDKMYILFIRNPGHGNVQIVDLFPTENLAEIASVHFDAIYGRVEEDDFISLTPGLLRYVKAHVH